VVGTGFNLDIDEVIGFENTKLVYRSRTSKNNHKISLTHSILAGFGIKAEVLLKDQLYERIPDKVAYLILFYYIMNENFIFPIVLQIQADGYIRQAWRFLSQSFFVIPFMMFEQRISSEENKKKYYFSHIFDKHNFKHLIMSGLGGAIVFLCLPLMCFSTHILHVTYTLISSNFILSI
jgi:hypothetical protein